MSSSYIIYAGSGLDGPIGPTGSTGATGATGAPGSSIKGATGSGITSITLSGVTYLITYGTAEDAYAFEIPYAASKGITGSITGSKNSRTYFTLKGTTSTGFSILNTRNLIQSNANLVDYVGDRNSILFDPVSFTSLVLSRISYTSTINTITLTGVTYSSDTTYHGSTGNLAYGYSSITVYPLTTNNYSSSILTLYTSALREVDISGTTVDIDNYRSLSVLPVSTESGFNTIAIDGYTLAYSSAKPLSSIDGVTTQSALYIKSGITGSIVYFGKQYDNDIAGRTTYSPQTNEIVYGCCCLESGKCIDYATDKYCNYLEGTFSANVSCSGNTCGLKACCYYDIVTDGVTCINARPEECKCYLGISDLSLCEDLTGGCTGLCPPTGIACADPGFVSFNSNIYCIDGKCYQLSSSVSGKTNYIPNISQMTFIGFDSTSNTYSTVGSCCTGNNCINNTSTECNKLGGTWSPETCLQGQCA